MRARMTWSIPQIGALASAYDIHEARLRIASIFLDCQRGVLGISITTRGAV